MPIMKKFIKTPDINGIVAIDSSPAGSSSVTRGLRKQAIAAKETATQSASKVKKMFSITSKGAKNKQPKPTAQPNLV